MGHEDRGRRTGYDTVNIQQAKDGIKEAVRSYLDKDAAGNYLVGRARQRAIMLMGAPGIGKTAIMSQIAAEMDIGYIGYTITHHTRQSAIGLPYIERRSYGGREYSITEYTLSEIIASVYEAIENQGKQEGILFIDEINCVSETLSPAMLDLLQNKKFGPHRIPEGWILVAAGNPPEYNSSVRDFDIVTLDRVRVVNVSADADVWLKYAHNNGIHDAITYYIQMKPQSLLSVERTVDGPMFATPRGWEDLSVVLKQHEKLGFPAEAELISQYIHDPDIAAEFGRYMYFHAKYKQDYDVTGIMEGQYEDKIENMKAASIDEKLAVTSVFVGEINKDAEDNAALSYLESRLVSMGEPVGRESVRRSVDVMRKGMRRRLDGNITSYERNSITFSLSRMEPLGEEPSAEELKGLLQEVRGELGASAERIVRRFDNTFGFMRSCFGDSQETVSFLASLVDCYQFIMFAVSNDFESFFQRNEELLVKKRDAGLAGGAGA